MREIKFRGKSIKSGKWYYGHFSEDNIRGQHKKVSVIIENSWSVEGYGGKDYFIENDKIDSVVVDPETVGQYTGLKDNNGREIYEGDIIERSYKNMLTGKMIHEIYSAVFDEGIFMAKYEKSSPFGDTLLKFLVGNINEIISVKVIGNIYENQDLLEAEK